MTRSNLTLAGLTFTKTYIIMGKGGSKEEEEEFSQNAPPGSPENSQNNGDTRVAGIKNNVLILQAYKERRRTTDGTDQVFKTKEGRLHMIQSEVNLIRNSVSLSQNDDPYVYQMNFKYDSTFECIITLYLSSTEARDPFNYPVYFLTPKNLPPPSSYKLKPGQQQKFQDNLFFFNATDLTLSQLL